MNASGGVRPGVGHWMSVNALMTRGNEESGSSLINFYFVLVFAKANQGPIFTRNESAIWVCATSPEGISDPALPESPFRYSDGLIVRNGEDRSVLRLASKGLGVENRTSLCGCGNAG